MLTDLLLTISDIPIPNFPVQESVASPGTRSIIIVFATIMSMLTLAYIFIVSGRRLDQGKFSGRRIAISSVVMFTLIFASWASTNADKSAIYAAADAYYDRLEEVSNQVFDELEQEYGSTINRPEWERVPEDTVTRIKVTLARPDVADQPCYLGAPDGYYVIRCGGDDFDTSTDLTLP
jgi:hypothetical protein